MRRIAYEALSGLPSKVVTNGIGLGGIVAAAWPGWFRNWVAQNVTAEQIRIYGIIAFGFFVAYWALMAWLKPKDAAKSAPSPQTTQTSYGPQSPNFGSVNGDVHFHAAQAQDRPTKLQNTYNIESLTAGLNEVLANVKPNPSGQPGLARFVSKPEPNLNLTGVLVRVYAVMGPVPNDVAGKVKFYQRVDHLIADKVSVLGLQTWGRLHGGLIPLSVESWQLGHFSHQSKILLAPSPYNDDTQYSDLHFWKREIDEIWPESTRTADDEKS